MRLVLIVVVLAATTRVAASDDSPADSPALPDTLAVTVTATSSLVSGKKTYQPWFPLATDTLDTRFWCEGKRDDGIAEALVLTFAAPKQIDSLTLRAGVWRYVRNGQDGELFRANNIVTGIDVITDDGRTKHVVLPEERKEVDVVLGGAPIKVLTLRLAKVKPGRTHDSCISGVKLVTTPERALLLGVDDAAAAALGPTFTSLWRALDSCDEATFRERVRFPLSYGSVGDHGLDVTKYKNAKALQKACKAYTFSSFHGATTSFQIKSESPATVTINAESLAWQLAFNAGKWQLRGLEDGSP